MTCSWKRSVEKADNLRRGRKGLFGASARMK
jgi:hypothetical protein